MKLKQQFVRTAFAWGALLAFMALFRPSSMPVVGLIIPFVLLYAALYSTWGLFGLLRARYLLRQAERKPHRQLGAALCASGVLLVVLQSLGQLTAKDVVTVLAIVALGYLYLTRSRFTVPKT